MLVLSRKREEQIEINGNITITVFEIGRSQVRLGIAAPQEVTIVRSELLPAIDWTPDGAVADGGNPIIDVPLTPEYLGEMLLEQLA
jgi:carbon storage regulator